MSDLEPRAGGAEVELIEEPGGPLQAIDHDALTGRVLVVDDTPFNRQFLRRLLDRIGHTSLEAADGRAALELLRDPATEPVDVILLDIMMPVMDGYDTIRAIRKQEQFKTLAIVAVTGKATAGERQRCIDAGASDYVPKPVDTGELLAALRPWLPAATEPTA